MMNSLGAENASVVNIFFRICVIFGDVQAMMILLLVVIVAMAQNQKQVN